MFKVIEKDTGKRLTVYAVEDNRFLVYESGQFRWISQSHYTPEDAEPETEKATPANDPSAPPVGADTQRERRNRKIVIENGVYRYTHEDMGGGVIELYVKETEKAFILKLLKNTCRYSPAHIDMLFKKSDRVIVRKYESRHAMRFSAGFHDYFVIYPFQAGIPFLFELVKDDQKGESE